MSERIATFTYAGHPVPVRPRDGYVNITALCDAEGKRARDVLKTKEARHYVALVEKKTTIVAFSLIERHRGRSNMTWAHPLVASFVAERLSPEAAFFVHHTLQELHLVGIVTELAERELATRVAEHVAGVVESRLEANKRREIPPWVRRRHRQCVERFYLGKCPSCGRNPRDLEFDHWRARGDHLLESTWLICRECNRRRAGPLRAKEKHADRAAFDLYQANLKTLCAEIDGEELPLFVGQA